LNKPQKIEEFDEKENFSKVPTLKFSADWNFCSSQKKTFSCQYLKERDFEDHQNHSKPQELGFLHFDRNLSSMI